MPQITVSATCSLDANSGQKSGYISGLFAGEAISAGEACRIDPVTGLVMLAVSTELVDALPAYAGFAVRNYGLGDAVTLFKAGARLDFSAGMTPGDLLYVSAVAGELADAPVVAGDHAVAMAINPTDVFILR